MERKWEEEGCRKNLTGFVVGGGGGGVGVGQKRKVLLIHKRLKGQRIEVVKCGWLVEFLT